MKSLETELPALPQFVPLRDVRRMLGNVARTTINSMVDAGTLPRPIKPRANLVLFERASLLAAVERMRAAT